MNNYEEDRGFLAAYGIEGVELHDPSGQMRVLLVPQWQGRVMTSTACGEQGQSYGWLNYPLIRSAVIKSQFNPVGGEERFWLGPEGGPFSFYFAQDKKQIYSSWKVPAALDTESFDVVEHTDNHVLFTRRMSLRNASGTVLNIGVERRVELLTRSAAFAALEEQKATSDSVRAFSSNGDPNRENKILGSITNQTLDDLSVVAYRSQNRITNLGTEAWTENSGAPSIWMLGMFRPSSDAIVFLGFDPAGQGKVVNTDYFGTIPPNRLVILPEGLVLLRADGLCRSKIGLPTHRACGVAGSYDAQNKTLTLLRYDRPRADARYVESRWGEQSAPFEGDVANAYNDGPTETGEVMGPFYEIESSSPAAFLQPGESITHSQDIFHFEGSEDALQNVAQRVIPGGLTALKNAFKS